MSQQWPGTPVSAAPAQPRPAPRPIVSAGPRPGEAADDARADAGLANDNTKTGIAVRNEQRDVSKTAFDQVGTLYERYNKLPEVKTYRVAIQELAKAVNTGDGAQADLALTYAFAKAMDPDSVVREAEQGMITSSQPWFQAAVENAKKQFGMDGAGNYTPEARKQIRAQIINSVKQRRPLYDARRKYFTEIAGRYGFDPYEVIGDDDGAQHLRDLQNYDRRMAGLPPLGPDGKPVPGPGGGGPEGGNPQALNPFDQTVDGQQVATGEFRTENDQQTADEMYRLWKAGRSLNEIDAYVKSKYPGANASFIPNQETLDYARKKLQRGEEWNPFTVTRQVQQTIRQRTAAGGLGGYASGATSALTVGLDDEIYGAAASMAGGDYETARDQFQVGKQASADLNPGANLAGQVTGGLIAAGIGGAGLRAVSPAAAEIAAANPVAANALYGAAYGAGESNDNRLAGAALGGAAGGAGGAVGKYALEPLVEAGANRLAARQAARASAPLTEGGEVIAAADRLNAQFGTEIAPIPADVGGPMVRRVTGGAAQLPLSAGSIVKGGQAVSTEAAAARDAIAQMAGNPAATMEAAGEAALNGAQSYIKRSRVKVNALYEKAKKLGGNQPVDLVNARDALDRNIAELSQTPGGAKGLAELKAMRAELDKPFPVEGVRNMRTQLRDRFMGDGLRGSDLERRVGQVIDAADDDIVDSLVAAGKGDAAKLYREAADAHRERVGVIDQVLAPIIGRKGDAPKSGEEIMAAIGAATQRNNARLGKFIAALPPEDAATVRATLIQHLGKASKGTQNAEGDAFSLGQFLTHWNEMTPQAKGTLFGGELRSALDDLAKVAEGTKGAQRYSNHSNTGSTVGLVGTSAGTPLGFLYAPLTTTGLTIAQLLGGAVLASPKIARMIAKTPSQPSLARKHLTQGLQKIAAGDKAIAATALGLQRKLMEAFDGVVAGAPQRLAAEPVSASDEESPTTAGAQR